MTKHRPHDPPSRLAGSEEPPTQPLKRVVAAVRQVSSLQPEAASAGPDLVTAAPGNELEFKLALPAEQVDGVLKALDALSAPSGSGEGEREGASRMAMRALYIDTDDGLLAARGLSLRLRREQPLATSGDTGTPAPDVPGGREKGHDPATGRPACWVQTLKLTGDEGSLRRQEHAVTLESSDAGTDQTEGSDAQTPDEPSADPSLHAGTEPGRVLQRLLKKAGRPALRCRASTDVERRLQAIEFGGSRVALSVDIGRLRAGELAMPISEMELELEQGPAAPLAAMARHWVRTHGLWLDVETKPERADRLARGLLEPPVVKARDTVIDIRMSAPDMLRAVSRSCLAQILPNASALAAGSSDSAHVHQLRVGLRRLRTAVRELGAFSGADKPHWLGPLVDGFRELGLLRDHDTVLGWLKPRLLEAGAGSVAWAERARLEGRSRSQVVRDSAFQSALIDAVTEALAPDTSRPQPGDAPPLGVAPLQERLRRLHRRLVKDGKRFASLSVDQQHSARKRLKRLRYLSEFLRPLFGPRAVERYLAHLKPAQAALGEHNDLAVAHPLARLAADLGDADAQFALRWIERQQRRSLRACEKAWRKMEDAPRFWKMPAGTLEKNLTKKAGAAGSGLRPR